ncbi:MAG: glycoside hydrolase family 16 protein [Caulobacteraceae bacterium]|nr:glycoside hydrolase family 16 protein [Caulobacteraceae bacterium]
MTILACPGAATSKTITFSGYQWTVRSGGYGSPGVGYWSDSNVFVDNYGYLHMKMTYSGGKWYSCEITSTKMFGMGTYQFFVIGRVDQLDKNVVLGIFTYPNANQGVNGTHEIDIEFSRWGWPKANMLNYTVWPVAKSLGPSGRSYPLALNGTYTTHRFIRSSKFIRFQSGHGHYDNTPMPIADWTYQPSDYLNRISQIAVPMHINLWSIAPPSNGQPVELIIRSFKYTP